MQLALILAVLAALVVSQDMPREPVAGAGFRLAVAIAGMGLVALFAAVASGMTASRLRRDVQPRSVVLQRFRYLRAAHAVLWLGTAGVILWGLDWGRLVRFNWHLNHVFLLDDLLIMVPVVVPIVLSWAAFYEVEHALRLERGVGGFQTPPMATRREYMGIHLRHYLGILLLPVLGLLAVQDGAELLLPGVLESEYAVAVYGPAFFLLFLLFPVLLRHLWQTEPLGPGTLRSRLEATARQSGLAVRRILVWQTGGLMANAAVAGMAAPLRYVFLTDGLLVRLSEDEIDAVFSHELGHVRHRHLLFRILAMVAPLSLWMLIEQFAPGAGRQARDWLSQGGLGLQVPMGLLTVGSLGAYMFLVFGFYSRLLEHEADLFACRGAEPESGWPRLEAFVSALDKLALASGASRTAAGWQHASIARRIDFLRRAAEDPRYVRRFHLGVRLLSAGLLAAVLSPAVCHLLSD
jgi:STE24 endopeptidase